MVVVEGAARAVADDPSGPHLEVVAAPGSGDDEIVAAVARAGDGPRLVVTADRELRRRVESLGAGTVGPRWLTDRTSGSGGSDPGGQGGGRLL